MVNRFSPRAGASRWAAAAATLWLAGCAAGDDDDRVDAPRSATVVTFNTGTSESMGNAGPDDGYGPEQAAVSDACYGDGLAWGDCVDAAAAFFATVDADIVAFQEMFYSGDCETMTDDEEACAAVPSEDHAGFVCETWAPGDPTVAQVVLGEGWQVACHRGKDDKCAAVRRSFGTFAGCDDDLCMEFLDGAEIDGCGHGSRVGRGTIELADGSGSLTLVDVHGSSGMAADDMECRERQFRQVFVDLGDGSGEPAVRGDRNLVLGDLNTDPGRAADIDPSAAFIADHVGEGTPFHFVTDVGPDAEPTYGGLANIDHVISDALTGSCWAAGVTDGHEAVTDVVYFDHVPIVCRVTLD